MKNLNAALLLSCFSVILLPAEGEIDLKNAEHVCDCANLGAARVAANDMWWTLCVESDMDATPMTKMVAVLHGNTVYFI